MECCCDIALCVPNGQILDVCPPECDIFFNVKLSECHQPSNCLISTMDGSIEDSASESTYGYIFSFILETIPADVS